MSRGGLLGVLRTTMWFRVGVLSGGEKILGFSEFGPDLANYHWVQHSGQVSCPEKKKTRGPNHYLGDQEAKVLGPRATPAVNIRHDSCVGHPHFEHSCEGVRNVTWI